MTENERFKVKGFDEYDQMVWDTEFEQSCSVEQVVNMLNNKDWAIAILNDDNEQLKQRNKRQYNQLTELWGLIENKDWETLTQMVKQMEEDEVRLKKEWGSYYD